MTFPQEITFSWENVIFKNQDRMGPTGQGRMGRDKLCKVSAKKSLPKHDVSKN